VAKNEDRRLMSPERLAYVRKRDADRKRRYREQHPEKVSAQPCQRSEYMRAYRRKYAASRTAAQREERLRYHRAWNKAARRTRYAHWRKQAEKRFDVTITEEQWKAIISRPCAYCGSHANGGVDRIDSDRGYHPDNCCSACAVCNMMKRHHPAQVFLEHVERIHRHQKRRRKAATHADEAPLLRLIEGGKSEDPTG
jgi:hypothetical protein